MVAGHTLDSFWLAADCKPLIKVTCLCTGMPSVASLERLESLREGEVASFSDKVPRPTYEIEASASSAPAEVDSAMQVGFVKPSCS